MPYIEAPPSSSESMRPPHSCMGICVALIEKPWLLQELWVWIPVLPIKVYDLWFNCYPYIYLRNADTNIYFLEHSWYQNKTPYAKSLTQHMLNKS